ncbi:MAG: helix-turn-helix domain-containing protein [Burkholderiaceae bacterium]|jgi:putative transcriptional regulator|nr:helix-turn-helix domain-containing protein [Burkholderiaceae bacterium]
MDKKQFEDDLLESVRQMKAGTAGRKTLVSIPAVVSARNKSGLTQAQFAKLLGVSVRTLRSWEQGSRVPSGAAQTLIRIADSHPNVLRELTT